MTTTPPLREHRAPPARRPRQPWGAVLRWGGRLVLLLIVIIGVASSVPSNRMVVRALAPIDARHQVVGEVRRPAVGRGRLLAPVIDVHVARWSEVAWYSAFGRAHGRLVPRAAEERAARQARIDHGRVDPVDLFDDAGQLALLAAHRAAGRRPEVRGRGVRVGAVGRNRRDSPLRSGDVVVRLNGRATRTFAELDSAVEGVRPGEPINVKLADGRMLDIPPLLEPADPADPDRAAHALGMASVETASPRLVDSDLRVRPAANVAGTSAGLALALAAWERLADAALAPGKVVYATGEVSSNGGVYAVGSVRDKAAAAARSGADVFIVAPGDADAARTGAGRREIRVVEAASVEAAIRALGGRPTNGCC